MVIDGITYSGETQINQIVPNNFTVYFSSNNYTPKDFINEGFILNWNCSQWGEWAQEYVYSEGTCKDVRRPIENGINIVGRLKYRKANSTCISKLNY